MEIKYILFAAASIIMAIWCWCSYNSGTGGSLGSLKKRMILGVCVCFSILTMLFINVAFGNMWKEAVFGNSKQYRLRFHSGLLPVHIQEQLVWQT